MATNAHFGRWRVLGVAGLMMMALSVGFGASAWAEDGEAAPAAEVAAPAPAAAAPAAAAPSTPQKTKLPEGPLEMAAASGFIGWVIIALSVVTLGLVLECFMSLKVDKLIPPAVLTQIEEALDAGEYEQAREICQLHDCALARVLYAGLSKIPFGHARMSEAMADEAEAQATGLHQKIGWINLIAGVAPMMGLLGTVQGMVTSFGIIATAASPTAADLAVGINIALLTTLEGLAVAIPASVAFVYLRGRVVGILGAMSMISAEVLDRFLPVASETPSSNT